MNFSAMMLKCWRNAPCVMSECWMNSMTKPADTHGTRINPNPFQAPGTLKYQVLKLRVSHRDQKCTDFCSESREQVLGPRCQTARSIESNSTSNRTTQLSFPHYILQSTPNKNQPIALAPLTVPQQAPQQAYIQLLHVPELEQITLPTSNVPLMKPPTLQVDTEPALL